jgi:putative glycosyltransferase (TIGR04372 family)
MRTFVSNFLTSRSLIRHRQYPTRSNTIKAALLVLSVLPLVPFSMILLAGHRAIRDRLRLLIIDIDSEFGHFVEVMERTRLRYPVNIPANVIVVLSRFEFPVLASLYEGAFRRRIWFTSGIRNYWLQILLLQPKMLIEVCREKHGNHSWMSEQRTPLAITNWLLQLRQDCQRNLGCRQSLYVTLAVNSLLYDEERAPQQVDKSKILESQGETLAVGVDYLRSNGIDVILLGSPDVGRSHVPRNLPRLSEFGTLGGPHEVALASGCHYFWSDCVGAWWLAFPFHRPVLYTNEARPLGAAQYVTHFVKYRTPDGMLLTWQQILHRELVEGKVSYKDATRGELVMVRNSPEEIVAVHKEMLQRLTGTYVEDARTKELRKEFDDLYYAFGRMPPQVSGVFLKEFGEYLA